MLSHASPAQLSLSAPVLNDSLLQVPCLRCSISHLSLSFAAYPFLARPLCRPTMAAHLDGLSPRHAFACRARKGRLSVSNAASPLCRTVPAARRALLTSLKLAQSCQRHARGPHVLVGCTQHPNRQETTNDSAKPQGAQEDSSDPQISSPESSSSSSSKNTKQQPAAASPSPQSSIPPHRHQQRRAGSKGMAPKAWLQRLTSDPKSNFPLRVLFNLAVLWVLMRLWPAGRSLHGEGSDELLVKIAYSDFVRYEAEGILVTVAPPQEGGVTHRRTALAALPCCAPLGLAIHKATLTPWHPRLHTRPTRS